MIILWQLKDESFFYDYAILTESDHLGLIHIKEEKNYLKMLPFRSHFFFCAPSAYPFVCSILWVLMLRLRILRVFI